MPEMFITTGAAFLASFVLYFGLVHHQKLIHLVHRGKLVQNNPNLKVLKNSDGGADHNISPVTSG